MTTIYYYYYYAINLSANNAHNSTRMLVINNTSSALLYRSYLEVLEIGIFKNKKQKGCFHVTGLSNGLLLSWTCLFPEARSLCKHLPSERLRTRYQASSTVLAELTNLILFCEVTHFFAFSFQSFKRSYLECERRRTLYFILDITLIFI